MRSALALADYDSLNVMRDPGSEAAREEWQKLGVD
jgi:hypothetical protein